MSEALQLGNADRAEYVLDQIHMRLNFYVAPYNKITLCWFGGKLDTYWQLTWLQTSQLGICAGWVVVYWTLSLRGCPYHALPAFLAQSAGAVEYTNCFSAEGKSTSNECPRYDTKQSDGEVPVMLELWGMQSTFSLPLLPGPSWPREVAPVKGPIYGLDKTKLWFLSLLFFYI